MHITPALQKKNARRNASKSTNYLCVFVSQEKESEMKKKGGEFSMVYFCGKNGDARELEPGSQFQFEASISIQIQIILGCAEFDKSDLCDTRVICVIQWRRESSSINVYVKVCADTCERTHLQNNIWWSDRSRLFTVWRLALGAYRGNRTHREFSAFRYTYLALSPGRRC